jgi:hypothetical protein
MRAYDIMLAMASAALLALAACSGTVVGTGGSGGGGTGGNGGGMSSTTGGGGTCTLAEGCMSDGECCGGVCDPATGVCMEPDVPDVTCMECACVAPLSLGGCANVCKMGLNGTTTPNFCDGAYALPQCAKCLADMCGSLLYPPDPTDPSGCM